MKTILFTKNISTNWLSAHLSHELNFEVIPFLKIENIESHKFIPKISTESNHFLISSQNAVNAILNQGINGTFFVVGEKTSKKLIQSGFKVDHFEHSAQDLAKYIIKTQEPKTWNFLCGNNRRDELITVLNKEKHTVNEIICYRSTPIDYHQKKIFDAITFFSPMGVRSYFKNNILPKSSIIFTIGNTTSDEVRLYANQMTVTADKPTLENLIKTINTHFDVEK